jgi:hypothetical protein
MDVIVMDGTPILMFSALALVVRDSTKQTKRRCDDRWRSIADPTLKGIKVYDSLLGAGKEKLSSKGTIIIKYAYASPRELMSS